jgi:hypothetical protein
MITTPNLPAKEGYVEVVTADGQRTYKNVTTGLLLDEENLPLSLEEQKAKRIVQSKDDLAAYLAAHPLQWTDGEYYSITAEKQQQLTSKLFSAYSKKASGIVYDLTWNSTGDICKSWTIEELSPLAYAIEARVTSLVAYQQSQEVAMRNAQTQEELDAIIVDYSSVPMPEVTT